MSIISLILGAMWLVLSFITSACAEITPGLFLWAFNDLSISSTLSSCDTVPIHVIPFNVTANSTIGGIAPYYMISFPVGGTPITDFIGTDPNNLSWQITQPLGSQLLLSVVDSAGNPGGSPSQLITVAPGQSTDCIKAPLNTPPFTVNSNVTGSLEPCAPWGISVRGGSPPYVITLAETNSPVVTNVTMRADDDRFTFINRATAGGQLFAAISDFEGRWASGTPVVTPGGPTDIDCPGLTSSSGNSTLIDAQDAAIGNASKRKKATNTAVIVVVVLLILFILGGGAFWLIRKRRQKLLNEEDASRITGFTASASRSEEGPSPGRWQVGSDVKRAGMRDSVAPPYRELETTRATASSTRPPVSVELRPNPLNRPQLQRLQMPAPVSNVDEKPLRSLASTDLVTSGAVVYNSPSQVDSTPNTSQSSGAPTAASRFATFPVTSIRKNPNAMGRSASASAAAAMASNPARIGRNATFGNNRLGARSSDISKDSSNPFVAKDEDSVLSDYMQYYQESAKNTDSGDPVQPPRYRSLGRAQRPGQY